MFTDLIKSSTFNALTLSIILCILAGVITWSYIAKWLLFKVPSAAIFLAIAQARDVRA